VTHAERSRIQRSRNELVEGGVPVDTYRRIDPDTALGLLAAKPARERTPARA
jgi:hypothetical protein